MAAQHPPLPPQHPPPPQSTAPRRRASFTEALRREGAGSRLLAWVGGAVTLLGVVLLLVLAIQRGWLGPLPRVLLGAGLGLGLLATGMWLHRNPAGRTGALALTATGVATLYLDVLATTALYAYLPPVGGLAVGLLVAVGGLLLAERWRSALLAIGVLVGCVVLAPFAVRGFSPDLVAFLLLLELAAAPVQLRRSWPAVALVAGVPPLLASLGATAWTGEPGSGANTAAALAVWVVTTVLSLLTLRRRPDEAGALALLASAAVPPLVAAWALPEEQAVPVSAAVAATLIGVWATERWQPGRAGDLAGAAGLVAALQATVIPLEGTARAAVLLGEALVLVLVAVWAHNRIALAGSLGFAVLGTILGLAGDLPPALLLQFAPREPGALAGGALVAALLLAAAVALPWGAWRIGADRALSPRSPLWLLIGGAALYGASGILLCGALLVLPDRSGFLLGHVVITVSWTLVALGLFVRGISVPAPRVIGLVLVAAAVAKLVLFDLAALDGMARVTAFLGAGLVLLAAGTHYARLVARSEGRATPSGEAGHEGRTGPCCAAERST
ncbi:DUF2339 domain-containing protein [Salinifilum aidingensis]